MSETPDPIAGLPDNPPPFDWTAWYRAAGGRNLDIPEVDALLERIEGEQAPRLRGDVAAEMRHFGSVQEASQAVKAAATSLGADMVGVCTVAPAEVYRGRRVGVSTAVVVGKAMRYKPFEQVPGRDTALECMETYWALGEICIGLAARLRAWGWDAHAQPPLGDSDVMLVPLAIKAGLGELGRHGSVIHPRFGPLFRLGCVLTELPLALDEPIDAGIGAFCDQCRACRVHCPADAIPDRRLPEAGRDPQGNARYLIDTGKCFAYFARHQYCAACLPTCVYNHKVWARDFEASEPGRYPTVAFEDPPSPTDSVPEGLRHSYPRLFRGETLAPWKARVRKRHKLSGEGPAES